MSVRPPRPPSPDAPLYRLRGEIDGVPRRFWLGRGEVLLGGSEACDLMLPGATVSRRHARLRPGPGGVEVEDLGSKNGTFVNGERVGRAVLRAGDALRLGEVTLKLEAVPAGDAELAVELDTEPEAPPGSGPDEASSTWPAGGATSVSIPFEPRLAEPFLDRLAALPDGEPAGALAALLQASGATGVALWRWPRRSPPVLVLAAGEPVPADPGGDIDRLVARVRAAPAAVCRSGSTLSESLSFAVRGAPGWEPLAAVLAGGQGAAAERERLLRLAVRLLSWRLAETSSGPALPEADDLPALVFPPGYVVPTSPAMTTLFREIRQLAASALPLLIEGESGAGKEHVAEILHASSPRARGPFVAVNCAALPRDLLEAEMFGIAEGTATGVRGRPGRIQQAQGGTLFLDEVGEMPPELQVKLLRALEEREIRPLGGRPQAVDIRLLAATNQDLEQAIAEGRFRQDLYFRLAGAVLAVPPLRRRRGDLQDLVTSLLARAAAAAGKPIRGLTVAALDRLTAYAWPGNVRELAHEIERLVHLCPPGQAIESGHLAERIRHAEPEGGEADSLRLDHQIERLEDELVERALEKTGGNQRQAAQLLGISRNRLSRILERRRG